MDIQRYDITISGEENPISIGLNLQKKFGLTHANIFALSDNEGPKVSDHLYRIAKQIVEEILRGENIDDINWTFTAGTQTSRVGFSSIRGVPYKLDISNRWAVEFEDAAYAHNGQGYMLWDIEKYSERYRGATPADVGEGRERRRELTPEPRTIFQVPCNHPDAKSGFFHCEPPYINTPHMRDDYDYVLVDTKKVLARLAQDDPDMLKHAAYKYEGSTASKYLRRNSIDNPTDMGQWSFDESFRGLTFCAGNAGIIKLAAELDLPYFVVTVSKSESEGLRQAVGYEAAMSRPMRPVFTPA